MHFPVRKSLFSRTRQVVKASMVCRGHFRGGTLGLVGESGCGKTPLGRAILRLVEPTSGQVCSTADLAQLSNRAMRDERRHLQMFSGSVRFFDPRMTVEIKFQANRFVRFDLHEGEARKRRVQELMAQVGLSPRFLRRYPHEFSGGQRNELESRGAGWRSELHSRRRPISALDVSINPRS